MRQFHGVSWPAVLPFSLDRFIFTSSKCATHWSKSLRNHIFFRSTRSSVWPKSGDWPSGIAHIRDVEYTELAAEHERTVVDNSRSLSREICIQYDLHKRDSCQGFYASSTSMVIWHLAGKKGIFTVSDHVVSLVQNTLLEPRNISFQSKSKIWRFREHLIKRRPYKVSASYIWQFSHWLVFFSQLIGIWWCHLKL